MERIRLTFPRFDDTEIDLVRQVLDSGWVTQGPMTERFEEQFAERHRVPHAYAVTSATAGLHLSAIAAGLGPEDEVIVPALTWITSANAAEYTGAKAVFADVETETWNLSPEALEAAITPRTRAIIVVHLFGLPAKMDEIMAIARRHDLRVIEDAACAVGSEYRGRPVGGFGDLGCFSFHPRKVITTGEGGMVTTCDEALGREISCLRSHGGSGLPDGQAVAQPFAMAAFETLGFNYRLSDILSAVGVAQMAKLDELLEDRRVSAARYDEMLADVEEVAAPEVDPHCLHNYQSYVIRVRDGDRERRNRAMDWMAGQGIQTRPGTHAVHRLGYYRDKYGLRAEDFPNAVLGEDATITLPLFPEMKPSDQERVLAALREGLGA